MVRQLFGTDGVRGRAGQFLSADLALRLARATVAHVGADPARVLIVRDTRESGDMLESAMAAGITEAGGEAFLAGVLPTPAAPLLLRRHGFDLAAVISASHNPYEDNGIKLFGSDGFKLDDDTEHAVEAELDRPGEPSARIGRIHQVLDPVDDYLQALQDRFSGLDLAGRSILLDCANGATYQAAPEIFRRLGAQVTVLADAPDGRNINAGCGSTHLDLITQEIHRGGHDVGFAFDGDGDRVLAVDRDGVVVDGDELIALTAVHLRDRGQLHGGGVAVTVMTNYGFHTAMREAGIEVATTAVGDRYVLDELRRRGWELGGEQSGHIINLDLGPSGDGIASALLTLEALGEHDLRHRDAMHKLPQQLRGVRAPDRDSLRSAMDDPGVQAAIGRADQELRGRGRVLVRASGTEPLIRVMVEAPDAAETERVCGELSAEVERALARV
ncbi:MAG TPA: phosphoglucosamine mutase [Solirubrobacteraceae bacterium]|nr:phosphoglucosamine mutase [Solirubrobacteraceae bacterium]